MVQHDARMKRKGIATRSAMLALLAGLIAACSGEVQVQSTSGGGTSTTGTGGSGGTGACNVEVPAGCACPSDSAAPWNTALSTPGDTMETAPLWVGGLRLASDGSTVLRVLASKAVGDDVSPAGSRLVKLDAAGKVVWEKPDVPVVSPTPDPRDCSTIVANSIANGQSDLLGQAISCGGTYCPVVARLDADGALVSLKVYDYGSTSSSYFVWIAGVLPDGRITLVGSFDNAVDFGKGPLVALPGPGSGMFVAQLSADGEALWNEHVVMDPGAAQILGFALSAAGDVAVTTQVIGSVDFGDGPISAPSSYTVVIASYDSAGNLRFGKALPGPSESPQWPSSLAYDSAGNLLAAGSLLGTWDFGGGPIGDPSERSVVVVAFDPTGQHLWSSAIATAPVYGATIAVDPADHVWVSAGSGELVELSAAGALIAKHTLGGSGERYTTAIGFAPGGAPVIAGWFAGTLDLGAGAPLVAQSKRDAFVAKLAP